MMQTGIEPDVDNKPSVKNFRKSEKVLSWFIDYVSKYIQRKDVKVDPFDTLVLKTHYNFTSHLFLTVFVFVTSHWLAEEPAICVDLSDRSSPPEELLEICLTYPYAEFPYNNDKNRMVRRYALHYKWVHIACFFVSVLYKGVLVAQTIMKYTNHRHMLEELCQARLTDRFSIAERYFVNQKGCHKRIYVRFLYLHLIAFSINVVSFLALNLTFQNQYWDLPKYLFLKRDPTSFHDPFSLVFPPFARCEITHVHHILVDRTKWFGCHLPLMEIYEKIFMIFWFWQVILAFWTIIFVLYNVPLTFCYRWRRNLLASFSFSRFDPFKSCAKRFTTDEIFALRAIATLIPGDDYARLLSSLLESKGREDPNATIYYDPLNRNIDMNVHSSFHSCNPENGSVDDTPPIGFAMFPPPVNPSADFETITTTLGVNRVSESATNPYSTWKRSISLEFDTSPLKRSMAFDNKLYPLMQYLRRDENFITSSTPTLSSPPVSEPGWVHGTYPQTCDPVQFGTPYYTGGEKAVHFEDEDNWENEDEDTWPTESAVTLDRDEKWTVNGSNYDANGSLYNKENAEAWDLKTCQQSCKVPKVVIDWDTIFQRGCNQTHAVTAEDKSPEPDHNWDEETKCGSQGKKWQ